MISIDECLRRIMEIPGARGVTLADGASGLAIAAAGRHESIDEHEDAAATTDVVRSVLACPALATEYGDDDVTEIIVCGTRGYHLLNLIDGDFDGRLFVHVLFDEESGNLALARFQLRGILSELTEGSHGT
ncbi:hypothetical protein C5E45_03380 [Nocardia nova]|uniref:Roadblock/LAMTOR2 domain-containing protein n=1 Tax=Nocardia nova TaxID=37330 RepID=A0A2S6AY70_9NOCA|nr:hypothetical protein [Nocardia nova]PPJ34064.1 hypothetical protein C5E41_00115 [Nocardia nova]PPJ40124.1 hypothetical protein C5E45_03380 [Nocardia nova]